MEIIKGQTINELKYVELELHSCNIASISGVAKVNLIDCEVGSISGCATVTMHNCKVNTIYENVIVEKATDCNIKTIKGSVTARIINQSTVHVITDKTLVHKMDNCEIDVVNGNTSLNKVGPNVNIDVVNDHANLGIVTNSHMHELSGNSEFFCIENSTVDYILGNVIINNLNNCKSLMVDASATVRSMIGSVIQSQADTGPIVKSKNSSNLFHEGDIESCDYIESSVVIGKQHNCMIPDKDTVGAKHTNEYTLTQDTTPTLWKQVNNIKDDLEENHMKTLTVLLADFYTESHNNTIVKTLELLNGVDITRRNNNKVEIVCSDEAFEVISAMYLYDYMMVEELLE